MYGYVLVAQSCPTICNSMDSARLLCEILQARILEWEAISSSRGSSQPRNQTQVSCFAGRLFTIWATWEAPKDHEIMINIINEAHICGGCSFSHYKIFADFLVLEKVYFWVLFTGICILLCCFHLERRSWWAVE